MPLEKWIAPAQRRQSLTSEGEFYFLNQSGLLKELGWDNSSIEKLWRYNQHYFDDLNALGSDARLAWHQSLISDWLENNPPGQGTGWEPYPTSLRIVNWVKWMLAGNEMSGNALHSLAIQTRWLVKRLETHLLGNHLFANAKALIFAGLVFNGPEADQWLAQGLSIVEHELPEQVLVDGGNFERSPMYHSIFFEDVLDLINIAQVCPTKFQQAVVSEWRQLAVKMLDWLQGMTHPDGQIALFNDAAFNVTPTPAQLSSYAARLQILNEDSCADVNSGLKIKHWAQSGYIRLQSSTAIALLDVAPIGPDYLPSHANADTLSFELSLFGQRVIVNGGTSKYGTDSARVKERQTGAHSTVEVNGQSSSEAWSGFRVARRAVPCDLNIEQTISEIRVSCAHDGYRRLVKPVTHRRIWRLSTNSFNVTDYIEGEFEEAIARFIFHPRVAIKQVSKCEWEIALPNKKALTIVVENGVVAIQNAFYACEFNRRTPTKALCIEPQHGFISTNFIWA
jgi:uncharacterized heparinase superfamily protein